MVAQHLTDLDEEAFAAAVAFFSAPTGNDQVISSFQEAKELRVRHEVEDPGPLAHTLIVDRAEAAG
jgi:hypothetical protein